MFSIIDVLPQAEHRACAKHMYANWSKKLNGGELQLKFWKDVWSTFEEEFTNNMKKMGEISPDVESDLMAYPPNTWCRVYFSTISKSWAIDNKFTKSFNAWINDAIYRPIRSMMEMIRIKTINRLGIMAPTCEKWINDYIPSCNEMFQYYKTLAVGLTVLFNGDIGYEINRGEDNHIVCLNANSCTCRGWDLSGIPCQHAICALLYKKQKPMDHISIWYHKESWQTAYRYKMMPVRGERFYKLHNYLPVAPPKVEKKKGIPQNKRTRGENEP